MATWTRVEGELDMLPGGIVVVGGDPIHVGFQIEPSRYAELDDAERAALHLACAPIARDTALLFCGRPGPLVISLGPTDRMDSSGVVHSRDSRHPIATFEVP
jgi:hypothetical protein